MITKFDTPKKKTNLSTQQRLSLESSNTQSQVLQSRLSDAKTKSQVLEKQSNDLRGNVSDLQKQTNTFKSQVSELKEWKCVLDAIIAANMVKYTKLTETHDAANTRHYNSSNELQTKLASEKSEHKTISSENVHLSTKIKNLGTKMT